MIGNSHLQIVHECPVDTLIHEKYTITVIVSPLRLRTAQNGSYLSSCPSA